MPPKLPNLKFRPKFVAQSTGASGVSGDGGSSSGGQDGDANPRPGAGGSNPPAQGAQVAYGDGNVESSLSSFQLERLQHRLQGSTAPTPGPSSSDVPLHSQATASASAPSSRAAGAMHAGRGVRGSDVGGRGAGASRRRGLGVQTRARQSVYANDLVDESAEDSYLPVNSMTRVLLEQAIDSTVPAYRPIAVEDPSLVAADPSALDEAAHPSEPVDAPSLATAKGTMFLEEHLREGSRTHTANLEFFQSVRRKSASEVAPPASFGDAEEITFTDADAPRPPKETLVWMQLPRFHTKASDGQQEPCPPALPGSSPALQPVGLARLPPGKVGSLKVYKSGRAVLELNGVSYDVCAQSLFGGLGDGMCCTAACLLPPRSRDSGESAHCYQLGVLQRKLVCTPTWSSETYREG